MTNIAIVLVLGAIAGFTIYLGLATSRIRILKDQTRYLLSALATGILIFLIYDVLNGSWNIVEGAVTGSIASGSLSLDAVLYLVTFFVGLGLGVLGLAFYEGRYLLSSKSKDRAKPSGIADRNVDPYKFAMMIAVGIGAHNFGEGLAIGESFATGAIALATVLVIGFALHNSTEGFGILGPLIRESERPNVRFLLLAGLVGGGPTFLGTVVGSVWASPIATILFLSFAAGALIYVTLTMYRSIASALKGNRLMFGIFLGVALGFLTDLVVSIGGV